MSPKYGRLKRRPIIISNNQQCISTSRPNISFGVHSPFKHRLLYCMYSSQYSEFKLSWCLDKEPGVGYQFRWNRHSGATSTEFHPAGPLKASFPRCSCKSCDWKIATGCLLSSVWWANTWRQKIHSDKYSVFYFFHLLAAVSGPFSIAGQALFPYGDVIPLRRLCHSTSLPFTGTSYFRINDILRLSVYTMSFLNSWQVNKTGLAWLALSTML
jgi:hypothetical protein